MARSFRYATRELSEVWEADVMKPGALLSLFSFIWWLSHSDKFGREDPEKH